LSDECPSVSTCPIFSGILKDKITTTQIYKKQYCLAGPEARNNCRRFQCKEKYGKVPDKLLPNSNKSVKDIGRENGWL
jgi:hypothetical protein